MSGEDRPRQRLDKWLWFARLAKTRTLAERLVEAGKVRVNRVRVTKPSRLLVAGDVVTAVIRGEVRVLRVTDTGLRRGPPAEARALYEDLSPPVKPPPSDRPPQRDPGAGRPTKRERRQIETWLRRRSRHTPREP